jgi:hypothetical protein
MIVAASEYTSSQLRRVAEIGRITPSKRRRPRKGKEDVGSKL